MRLPISPFSRHQREVHHFSLMLYSLRPWLLTYDHPLCTTSSNLFSFQQPDARVTRFQGGGMVEAPIYSNEHNEVKPCRSLSDSHRAVPLTLTFNH